MFPKKIRDWFDHQPPGGLTSIPASPHLLMLILRGLFIAITIGIATGALSYFISPCPATTAPWNSGRGASCPL